MNDEIIRIAVSIDNKKTSVSFDSVFIAYLSERLGGLDAVRGWVKETAVRLEREWQDKAVKTTIGGRVRAATGLSRAIQREALHLLMKKAAPLEPLEQSDAPVVPGAADHPG
jgi:hypothetical protein